MNPEIAQYEALAKEILRRCMAEEGAEDIFKFVSETLSRMGAGDAEAAMSWGESFDLVERMLAEYETIANTPAELRKVLDWPWQSWRNLIDPLEDGMLGVVTAPDGQGKCLARGTKVIMFDGTLRAVETLTPGDKLMGPDSLPRTIKALGHGRGPMYWVRQNRGLDYRVNADHILALLRRDEQGYKHPVEMTVTEVLQKSPGYIRRMLQGYKVGLYFHHKDVRLDPYFLGLWLGDGNKRNGTILASDPEVIDWLKKYALTIGCGITVVPDNERGSVMRVLISNGRGGLQVRRGSTPAWQLSEMGLIENKHIPHEYIANSADVRLQLLAGLIDSDGYYYASSKAYDITQKDERLARQIKYLADSLGFRAIISKKKATIKDIGYECDVWLVRIIGDVTRIPVKISRKEAEDRSINKDWRVCGIEIEPSGEDEYFGFVLDGDGLFLLEDCTVTHNTIYGESIAEYWAEHKNRVVYVHYELNRKLMMLRRTSRHSSIAVRDLKGGKMTWEQKQKVKEIRSRLESWDGYITYLHTPGWSMEKTCAELRRLNSEGLCDVVVLDYLEKASASRRQLQMFGTNLYQREADNVEQLKTFAEMTEIPVIMIVQMSKEGKSTTFDKIDRTGMRGAGEKSDKANLVVMLKRERTGDGYSNEVEVLVDKNTMGSTGTFKQIMVPEYFRVGDIFK